MAQRGTESIGYSAAQRLIHWIMALLIIPMLIAGLVMVRPDLPRSLQNTLFIAHKNIGVLLLLLVLLRLVLRLRGPAPAAFAMPAWQRRAAAASHAALYALMVIVPLSGYVRVRAGGFPIEALDRLGLPGLVPRSDALASTAKAIHDLGGSALIALILLHLAAALHHALIRRDGLWARIWPPLPRG